MQFFISHINVEKVLEKKGEKFYMDMQLAILKGEWDKMPLDFYDVVAIVEADSLEDAWKKTNHIHSCWCEGEDVVEMIADPARTRSSMIGDIFKDEFGVANVVASIGFELFTAKI